MYPFKSYRSPLSSPITTPSNKNYRIYRTQTYPPAGRNPFARKGTTLTMRSPRRWNLKSSKKSVLTRFEGTAVPILQCPTDLKGSRTSAVELVLKIQWPRYGWGSARDGWAMYNTWSIIREWVGLEGRYTPQSCSRDELETIVWLLFYTHQSSRCRYLHGQLILFGRKISDSGWKKVSTRGGGERKKANLLTSYFDRVAN